MGRQPQLPKASLSYLEDYLFEVGPTESGGFGPAPLSFQELDAWARRVPHGLQPWEFIMLRRLSIEWAAESSRATEHDCPAPWNGEVSEEELRAVAKSLKSSISGMAK